MRRSLLALGALALAGCSDPPRPPMCITVDTSCSPLYEPTFDNVWNDTLKGNCGSTNSSCHAAGGQGFMSLADEDTAYDSLLGESHFDPPRARVVPGDPSCSLMIVRTDSPGASYQMPIGTPLQAAERCALIQWVACGAPGPGSSCTQ